MIALLIATLWQVEVQTPSNKCVILLHGLGRSASSMSHIGMMIEDQGYRVINVDYDSQAAPIASLADAAVDFGLERCDGMDWHGFVTHSMGGILVRSYYARHDVALPDAVVMLGPPNHGSDIINHPIYAEIGPSINGPAGNELGVEANSTPNSLPPVNYPVGIIAGNQSINPIFSAIVPGEDDGTVAVSSTHLEGETDHIVLPTSHSFMMWDDAVIAQAIAFLNGGQFAR